MSVKINLNEQIQNSSENTTSDSSKGAKPNKEDVDEFSSLMKRDEKIYDTKQQTPPPSDSYDLSSIFSALIQGKEPQAKTENNQISQQDLASAQKIADNILERILVSEKRLDGSIEVKLLLNDNAILKQTEISLTRDLNGMLFVNITSSDNNSYQKLLSSKAILEKQLEDKEDNPVRVEISFKSEDLENHNNLQA